MLKGNSIISLPDSCVILDVETTGLDYEYCEIIEVAAIKISNGAEISRFSSLVRPSDCDIGSFIEELTGITSEMLLSAPLPDDTIPALISFIGDSPIVAHNASFDIGFLCRASEKLGFSFANDYIDTLRIARKLFPDLPHHRLRDIVKFLGVSEKPAHRAEADCIATLNCYLCMRKLILDSFSESEFAASFKRRHVPKLDAREIASTKDSADPTNPLFGKVVVFTGALSSMDRRSAMQIVADLGGINANGITKKTNYLVIGSSEFASSVKNGKTNKMKKAEGYIIEGCDISILSESVFWDMVNPYLSE